MPAAPRLRSSHSLIRPVRFRFTAGLLTLLLAGQVASSQPPEPPAEVPRAGAFKLPDGTVIFFSKTPDEANPPVDGVLLSPQEFKALVDQAEQLKKLKAGVKSQAPSGCQIHGRVEVRGVRTVAALSLTYAIRTTQPKTIVALGCHLAFPVAARLDAEKLPPHLASGEDGLTALIERPGDHSLTLEIEVPVTVRGMGREVGYELSLPRAAITTLAVDPPAGVARIMVGTRTAADRPGELTQTSGEPGAVSGRPAKPVPLGPVERLVVSWEASASQSAGIEAMTSAEHDIVVRVDETQIETTDKIRLRGSQREWILTLPAGAEVSAARVASSTVRDPQLPPESALPATSTGPSLVRPVDPSRSIWRFLPPDGPGPDWELTVTNRQTRPNSTAANHHGPYSVDPYVVQNAARQSGTIKVYAPPTIRLRDFKPAPAVRRPDVPSLEESLVAHFRFAMIGEPKSVATPIPLLQFEARQIPGFIRVQPTYELTRVESGWRLKLTAKIAPVRTELERVIVDIPPGWEAFEAGPAELVDEVQVLANPAPARRLGIGLVGPQKGSFDLTVTAIYSVPVGARESVVPLLRFPNMTESGSRVIATVPEPLEVRGTAFADGPAGGPVELLPVSSGTSVVKSLSRATDLLDRGVSRVHLTWQPYRPDLVAEVQAEVGLQDRQAIVSQVIRFRSVELDSRPIRLKGPIGLGGLRASPPLDPIGPGEWSIRPSADPKDFTLSLSYALPIPTRRSEQVGPTRFVVGLLWPDSATRVDSVVRVWGAGTTRRVERFEGPWRELPPEPVADRDSLPWLTLAGSGGAVSLILDLSDPGESVSAGLQVDRSLLQAWITDDGAVAVRGRFVLRRWSSNGIDLDVPAGVAPTILLDDRKVEPTALAGAGEGVARVRLPVPTGSSSRSLLRLDVRYQAPPARSVRGAIWQVALVPPHLNGASYSTSPRWQVVGPAAASPLSFGRDLLIENRWMWRQTSFGPGAGMTTEELERWIRTGTELDPSLDLITTADGPDSGALIARQPTLGSLRIILLPRVGWVTGVSLAVFAIGYGLSRMRASLLGPVLAVLGISGAFFVIVWPQPAAEIASAAQPGLVLLAVVLVLIGLYRWYHRRSLKYLPGFSRGSTEVMVSNAGVSSTSPRSSKNGPAAKREESSSSSPLASTGS